MKILVPFLLIAVGVFNVWSHPEGLSPLAAGQVVICVGGSALYLVWSGVKYLLSFKKAAPVVVPQVPAPTRVSVPVTKVTKVTTPKQDQSTGILPPNNFELYDNTSLIHIRNRLRKAGNKEGLELCAKLATIMFELDDEDNQSDSPEGQTADVKTKVSV